MKTLPMGTPFGPQSVDPALASFAIPIEAGNLTALATRNIETAERLAVFIPGFTGSKEDFIQFLPILRESISNPTRTALLAYSQRGQADSFAPRNTSSYTLEDFIQDGCKVLKRVGAEDRKVDLVGHSFGGVVARRIALRKPEYLRSLVMFSSGATSIPRTLDTEKAISMIEKFGPSVVYRGAFPQRKDVQQPEPEVEMFRLRAHATSVDNLLSIASILATFEDVTEALKQLDIPMMSVFGANDTVWPSGVYAQEAARLSIPAVSIPKAGHSAQLDTPHALAHMLTEFWQEL